MDRDTLLSIAHLNKLFLDIKQNAPPIGSSQQVNEVYEQKIYNILPLFCKIFNNNESPIKFDRFEKFADQSSFTQMVSRLMVTEIRRRASNKTTEKASISIVEFLEISPTVNTANDKKGWILLSTLNILVSFNSSSIISIMTAHSLASTLVKCLYLFFDLPPCIDTQNEEPSDYLSNSERRQLLQKVFSQLLTRLCSSPSALSDLTRKDDLSLLFNVITSWCPEHNSMWRKTASDVIITMAKFGNINLEYLHTKNCINLFVENVQRIVELGTTSNRDVILMFDTLIQFMSEYLNNTIPSNHGMINVLLDDFSACFGYQFLVDFALKLEQLNEYDLLQELLLLVQQFTKVGISILKPRPLSVNQLFIIENFSIPSPSKNSIKNLKAFNIIVSLWSKFKVDRSQESILDSVLEIYKDDKANYFVLEGQNTLSSFGERLEGKSESVQTKYYTLLDYVVVELNYVPCKELITVGIILKRRYSIQSIMLCINALNKLLKFNSIFRDVFREVGLLDIICSTYVYYTQMLDIESESLQTESILLDLLQLVMSVLSGSNSNSQIFHDCGASKHTFLLVMSPCGTMSRKTIRKNAFAVIQQLVLSNCSEENLSQLLVLLHKDKDTLKSTQEMFSLKQSVLKSLLIVLSENHRIRALFRKIGGFVSVISVIVHMENCLSQHGNGDDPKRVWNLLRCVFASITTAMRFEPANSKYFAQEICSPSFTDSLRLLGCFDENIFAWKDDATGESVENYEELFNFPTHKLPPREMLSKVECACVLMRLLYDMALDILDKVNNAESINNSVPIIVYPCVINSMIQLIQFIPSEKLCYFLIEKIRLFFSLERNLQVMCDIGLVSELMNSAYVSVLLNEKHTLYHQIQYIFERLSSHYIPSKDLRTFLRLSNPLNSIPIDEINPKKHHQDRSITLSRIKSIISMSTPKDAMSDFILHPPFIEFDMSQEGFSCIFIPSIAPISTMGISSGPSNILTGAIVGNPDVPVSVNGGIGTGERAFPSQSGLSFSTWLFITKSLQHDDHTINVLTIYRATESNQEYSCFQLYINLQDKTLCISTQELPIFSTSGIKVCLDSDHNIRIPVPELFKENWHHIAVILNRTLLKNSTVNVYINGKMRVNQKLHYISSIVGGSFGIANASPVYVNGFIGTPPQYRRHSKLIWKQGPCHLIEEPLNAFFVSYIYMLGPNYIGSFQTINYLPSNAQFQQQQIAEDRLIFGLNSRATSVMTLSKMRRVYSKFDCRQIAKIIGLSTHENATPIYVLHNSAGHLCGPSRALGGVLIGNIGARCFVPKQIPLAFSDIGGALVLLGLIANSKSMESLYASVKASVCVLRANRELQLEMERINGYQILSMLLKRKKNHLNSHILNLLFELICKLNSRHVYRLSRSVYVSKELTLGYPSSYRAFKELLVDPISVWIQSDLLKTLLEYFNETIYESSHTLSEKKDETLNLNHLREMNLLPRLLNIFKDQEIQDDKTRHLILVIYFKLLSQTTRSKDLLYFGQFIVALLPVSIPQKTPVKDDNDYGINLRNSLLKIILQLMTRQSAAVNASMQEELIRVLGFDWFLLFLSESLNLETVTIGFVNLMLLLSNPSLLQKFKDGLTNGNWLKEAEDFIENKSGLQLLGFNISTGITDAHSNFSTINSIQRNLFTLPGFQHLNWLMSNHVYQPKIYLIIFQTLLGCYRSLTPQTLEYIETFHELELDRLIKTLFTQIDAKKFKQEEIVCKDLLLTIISMIRQIFCSNEEAKNAKYVTYPSTLINFIKYLYNNNRDMRGYCQTNPEFLNALCKCLVDVSCAPEPKLTEHPARKLVFDLILTILVNIINANQNTLAMSSNSSSFFSSQKPTVIFDNILTSLSSCKSAQTEIISLFLDCIMNSLDFNAHSNNLSVNSTNVILNFNQAYANIVSLMSTVVDKLWQNCYVNDRKKILECFTKILKTNAPESKTGYPNFKSLKNLTSQVSEINMLYKSTNRCVLYLISRNVESIADRVYIFEVLQLIYSNRQVILVSKCNNDAEFFICLTHCLLQLIDEENISLSASRERTTWYVVETNAKNSATETDEGAVLVASVAKNIWDEIYLSKKSLLEETLKISLAPPNSAFGVKSLTPDISQMRDVLYESTLKYWYNYIESENQRQRRKPTSLSFDLPIPNSNLLSEKLTNINKLNNLVSKSGGLMSKIVGGTSEVVGNAISSAVGTTRKEVFRTTSDTSNPSSSTWTIMSQNEALYWTSIHTLVVKDFIEFQLKQKRVFDYHLKKFILNEWLNYEYEFLTRERAIWGPSYGSKRFDKWMLDMTEGPNRMRKKLIRNDQFYLNYPYRPEVDGKGDVKQVKFKSPISLDSKDYYKRVYGGNNNLLDKDEDTQSFEYEIGDLPVPISDSTEPSNTPTSVRPDKKILSEQFGNTQSCKSTDYDDIEPDLNDPNDSFDLSEYVDINSEMEKQGSASKKEYDDSEMQTILRLLEEGEKISHMFRIARIQGLDSYEGLLLFGKENFYLIDGFTLLKTREIRDIDSLPLNTYDPIIPSTSSQSCVNVATCKKVCNKFAYQDIREVHKRRYLLQPIALEIFSMDGRNSLVVFPRSLRNKVYARFMSVAIHITDSAQDSLMGQKRSANVETGGLLSNLIGETSVTQRWVRGEISNFQYLMNLNTLAGRSYNDLMQYPVFPWILANYTSSELDFSDPATFRDLSRPMGAQTLERLEQFRKRFNDFDSDTNIKGGDDLIQGPYHYGTFYSSAMIVASYLVRMEPFTQHFLRLQGGHFDLADRMFHSIGDAWMSASKHNMADLKELIPEFFYLPEFLLNSNRYDFGCKQNGVRLDDIILPPWAKDDPREFIRVHRAALECDYVSAHLHEWIDLIFGYKQNGPAAIEAVNVFHHLFYEGNADIYNIDDPLKKNATIGFINNFGQVPKQLFKKPHPAKKVFNSSPGHLKASLSPILSTVNSSSSITSKVFIHNLENLKPSMQPIKELKGAVGQIIQQEKTLLAVEQNKVLLPPLFNRYVAWGFADHSLRLGPYESDRALYVWESELFPPNGEILCATVPNPSTIITAGTSSVISVWRIKNKSFMLTLAQKLYGHSEAITCLASSSSYGIVVSGSRDNTCILWDLNRLVFIRQLGGSSTLIHTSPIAAVAINDLTGDIATCCSTMLYLWSINGILIASVNTLSLPVGQSINSQNSSQILCIAFSTYNEWDPDNVILTGSSDGIVKMWHVRYVQEPIESNEQGGLVSPALSDSSISDDDDDDDIKNSSSLNPSKDEIVRRLSIVSLQNESQNEDSTENSTTPVDHNNEADWDLLQSDNADNYLLSHSKSFNEYAKQNLTELQISTISTKSDTLSVPNIRNSKSDTALVDSFIVVSESKTENVLKSGHRWAAKLMYGSKLTMHTAYERKDNKEPAAITCIAVSKDHRNIFVGDARGRIFSWSVNENRNMSDHWIKDDTASNCFQCSLRFSITERKHHCRNCGKVFCAKCSRFESTITRLKLFKPVRVCQKCFLMLQQQK